MSNNLRVKAILGPLFLMFALVLASCAPGVLPVEDAVRAWVGGPPDGSEVPVGVISAMCHGYARAGVAHLELWVNGAFASRAGNPDPAAQYFTNSFNFETTGPGSYVLHCRTYAQDGEWAQSAPVTVRVPGESASPTATQEIPTVTPTSTGVATDTPTAAGVPTGTPTATGVPTDTPTSTPTSTLTPTPQLVRIISYEADHTQIVAGECVRFTWQVEAPTAIYFDGEGVGNYPDSRERCPTSTRAFELRAEGSGGPDVESITIVVTPGDTDGPSIGRVGHSPGLIWWDESDSCGPPNWPIEVSINAHNITDPSGVSGVKVTYRVVEANRPAGQWQAKSMNQVQTGTYSASIGPNDLELSLNPPVSYGYGNTSELQYYIQAFDGVGNRTDSSTRTVTVQYCYIVT